MHRRDALARLVYGAAGFLMAPRGSTSGAGELPEIASLASRLRRATHEEIYDLAAGWIRAGAGHETLLAAAFVAGIHDIRPRSVGGKLHAVMMVESAYQLAASAPRDEALLAGLWSLHDFKLSQERDRRETDWVLPKRPVLAPQDEPAARRELIAAMGAWDADRADRAVVALLPHHDLPSLFELLWPFAARCYVDIGHKIIFCAQVERALRRLHPRFVEPAARSLVNGLLYRDDSISGSEAEVYDRSRELASSLTISWRGGKEEPEQSPALLRALRGRSPAESQQLVVDALTDGVGAESIWDALRLYASELLLRRPQTARRRHGPVHPVTEINAFHYAWRTTTSDETRKLLILQAAAWLSLLRRDLIGFFGALQGPGIDVLGNDAGERVGDLAATIARRSPAEARAMLDASPDRADAFVASLRRSLVHRAFQSHQFKYAAAIQEESVLVQPRFSSRILAPAIDYLPTPADDDTEHRRRALHALRSAGVPS